MKKLFLFAFIVLTETSFAQSISPRLISVSGSSERSFTPDMARVLVNVWGKSDNAKNAQKLANDQNENFKKVISDFGIKKEDIMTTGYDLTPDYSYDNKAGVNKIIGHTASQTIRVTLKKTEIVGKFLDALIREEKNLKSGTNVQGVSWDIEKRDDIQRDLLAEAVNNAEAEANVLAKAARVKIKNVFHLSPQNYSSPVPMFQADALMMKSAGGARETTVFAGEIKVKAQVAADYEIE